MNKKRRLRPNAMGQQFVLKNKKKKSICKEKCKKQAYRSIGRLHWGTGSLWVIKPLWIDVLLLFFDILVGDL